MMRKVEKRSNRGTSNSYSSGSNSKNIFCLILGMNDMKKIEIIVPDRLFNDVNRIIKDAHDGGMTFQRVEGRGKIKAKPVAIDRGTRHFTPEFIPRIKMEVVVKDDQVEPIVSKIAAELANPAIGGKIFVVDVATAVDLATKEEGENAL
jgi:nitrogen regulatory protein P-II 1